MTKYESTRRRLATAPRTWLITGVAGFIGSNLLEALLRLGQRVVGLDNFSSGHPHNLAQVRDAVMPGEWRLFHFIHGDICSPEACRKACGGVDVVLHHAALGSVPRSMEDPLAAHGANVTGFLNMLTAAREAGVERFVYAGSSAVYGDDAADIKSEPVIGRPLSPYAATKLMDELYAEVFARCYGLRSIGLRYFNVFGPRQSASGAYAAVIPQWIAGMLRDEPIYINGDGETARDFCYIEDVVQANLLAAMTESPDALNQSYNVGAGDRTTLNELFEMIRSLLEPVRPRLTRLRPIYREFRPGDVRLSQADIDKARKLLEYQPMWHVRDALACAIEWYVNAYTPAPSTRAGLAGRQPAYF